MRSNYVGVIALKLEDDVVRMLQGENEKRAMVFTSWWFWEV